MNQIPTGDNDAAPNAIVLVVDGLSAAMLGAYGNTWFETANFNRLAASSLIFDYAFACSTKLEHSYRKVWRTQPAADGNQNQGLIDVIANLGAATNLLTDEPLLGESGLADSFDSVVQVAQPATDKIAEATEQTELANFFAQATSWLVDLEPGSLGWIHSRGLAGAWDAPHKMRASLAGEDDPVPSDFHKPPSGLFDLEQDDPDDLLGYQQACAAQVMLLDQFLGVLLDLMEAEPIWQSTLLCFTSTRGYPLGEHGIVGHGDELLSNYNESVHVPMMISFPPSEQFNDFRSIRNGNLIQTDLIYDCLIDWFDNDPNRFLDRLPGLAFAGPEKQNQAVVVESHGKQRSLMSIQTQAWKLIKEIAKDDQQIDLLSKLYAKPDDRWEVNDVGRRCPHIVDSLSTVLDSWLKPGGLGGSGELGLEEALWTRAN